jgi:hypothetical protein
VFVGVRFGKVKKALTQVPRVAYFSDAYQEANGVATVCREFESFDQRHHVPWFCVHGGSATQLHVEGTVIRLELRRSIFSFPWTGSCAAIRC